MLFQLEYQPLSQSGQPCGENKNNPEQDLSEYFRARVHFLQSTDSRERKGEETEVWPIKYLIHVPLRVNLKPKHPDISGHIKQKVEQAEASVKKQKSHVR